MKQPIVTLFRSAMLKIVRHPGTPHSIGCGVAIGCFTAFFIPFSFQLPFAFALAVRLRAARIAALLLTWISNPLTIPFIYPVQCYAGAKLIRIPLSFAMVKTQLATFAQTPSLKLLNTLGSELLLSFFVGGLLFGSAVAIIGYFSTVHCVRCYRKQRLLHPRSHKEHANTPEPHLNPHYTAK